MSASEPTLHEALAALGWTSTESAKFQKRDVFNEDGELVGSFTAHETWDFLKQRRHDAGDLCAAGECDDCDPYHRAADRQRRDDAREGYGDWLRDEGKDARGSL